MTEALVIGAGPAGLMAARELAREGMRVLVVEARPSVGRKFLMAGKSGLNLTKVENFENFLAAYGDRAENLRPMLKAFGPNEVRDWARDHGQEIFTGSSGRVFPKVMKASPLLRSMLRELGQLGVVMRTRWRWEGWEGGAVFDTPEGRQQLTPGVTVLACGGASWARLGSDGAWAGYMDARTLSPFRPANMGFVVAWSPHMARHFGHPVKGVELHAGKARSRGEFIISAKGLEGGGLYEISAALREGAPLTLDLMPDLAENEIRARLARVKASDSLQNRLRKALGLDPAKQALLMEFTQENRADLARAIKALGIRLQGARPMDEAISTAGGLRFEALDAGLMLRERPGVFAAGEMLDWEAPTGGYLLTACLATGLWAGRHAARYALSQGSAAAL